MTRLDKALPEGSLLKQVLMRAIACRISRPPPMSGLSGEVTATPRSQVIISARSKSGSGSASESGTSWAASMGMPSSSQYLLTSDQESNCCPEGPMYTFSTCTHQHMITANLGECAGLPNTSFLPVLTAPVIRDRSSSKHNTHLLSLCRLQMEKLVQAPHVYIYNMLFTTHLPGVWKATDYSTWVQQKDNIRHACYGVTAQHGMQLPVSAATNMLFTQHTKGSNLRQKHQVKQEKCMLLCEQPGLVFCQHHDGWLAPPIRQAALQHACC